MNSGSKRGIVPVVEPSSNRDDVRAAEVVLPCPELDETVTFFTDKHSITVGTNFETFDFFNSFNIFRHGVFFLPDEFGIGSTFESLDDFKGHSLQFFTSHSELVRIQSAARTAAKAEQDGMIRADADWSGDDFVGQSDALARG